MTRSGGSKEFDPVSTLSTQELCRLIPFSSTSAQQRIVYGGLLLRRRLCYEAIDSAERVPITTYRFSREYAKGLANKLRKVDRTFTARERAMEEYAVEAAENGFIDRIMAGYAKSVFEAAVNKKDLSWNALVRLTGAGEASVRFGALHEALKNPDNGGVTAQRLLGLTAWDHIALRS